MLWSGGKGTAVIVGRGGEGTAVIVGRGGKRTTVKVEEVVKSLQL